MHLIENRENLWGTRQVAAALGVSKKTVHYWIQRGSLVPVGMWPHGFRAKPTWLFRPEDVQALVDRRADDFKRRLSKTRKPEAYEPAYIPVYRAVDATLQLDATIRGLARQAVYARRAGTPEGNAAADAMLTLRSGLLREQMALRQWERSA